MIQAVIFDLDGTLLDRDSSLHNFIDNQYKRLSFALKHIPQQDYINKFIELDCRGHVWKDKVYQILIKEFEIDRVSWQYLLKDYEMEFMNHCIPFPNLLKILNTLRAQNYLLGIITNGREVFQSKSIRGLGIQNYFQTIVVSEAEQIRKPKAEIFHIALSRLMVLAENSVYVGDNPQADITGAKNAGLKAIWKSSQWWTQPAEADRAIDELNEIPITLKQLKNY